MYQALELRDFQRQSGATDHEQAFFDRMQHFITTLWVLAGVPAVLSQSLRAGAGLRALSVVRSRQSWGAAREFCRKHFVDLAVADTVEKYDFLVQETAGGSESLWMGLFNGAPGGWQWVDGGALNYNRWYRETQAAGMCGCLERSCSGPNRLLPRLCQERQAFICQGVSLEHLQNSINLKDQLTSAAPPSRVEVVSVGMKEVTLCWDMPPFMHAIPHSFNVTVMSLTASDSVAPTSSSSSSNSSLISGLQPGSLYSFCVSTITATGIQSEPACVTVTTGAAEEKCAPVDKAKEVFVLLQ
ncbi:hypothetical protein JZ751_029663 [Albula glossodonta]|uniref:C-type lectin domain-containing protein n=1 Tax=Albula glossodonta TaxID=121402 RepID=A0A8T2N9U4_9TELE|nr:hypothetical protein JZ751_029663 [Albula glossodonta]